MGSILFKDEGTQNFWEMKQKVERWEDVGENEVGWSMRKVLDVKGLQWQGSWMFVVWSQTTRMWRRGEDL